LSGWKSWAELYEAAAAGDEQAKRILQTRSRFYRLIGDKNFDPLSGKVLPCDLDGVLRRAAEADAGNYDPVYRIARYVRPAIKALLSVLKEDAHRIHTPLPLARVRETDGVTIRSLAKKPGRNVREKLASSRTLLAVKRFMDIDLPENRLFKAFVKRLVKLLKIRRTFTDTGENDIGNTLCGQLSRWLEGEAAEAIGAWTGTPPNNTLLQDKNYRKIWKAWIMLHQLDEMAVRDMDKLANSIKTIDMFTEAAEQSKERRPFYPAAGVF